MIVRTHKTYEIENKDIHEMWNTEAVKNELNSHINTSWFVLYICNRNEKKETEGDQHEYLIKALKQGYIIVNYVVGRNLLVIMIDKKDKTWDHDNQIDIGLVNTTISTNTSNNSAMSRKVKQFIDGLGCEINVEDKE